VHKEIAMGTVPIVIKLLHYATVVLYNIKKGWLLLLQQMTCPDCGNVSGY
jgi:hypothetical protein